MSIYNLMRKHHPLAGALLNSLGFDKDSIENIPRLRDCFLFEDDIRILTRTGGANRQSYEEGNKMLTELPGFIRDWDDQFDNTYAWWSYRWPTDDPELTDLMKKAYQKIAEDEEMSVTLLPESMKEITDAMLKSMSS